MRVLFVASEAAPFAKTGGLADVAGALPGALARLGCEVTLVMPAYQEVFGKHTLEDTGIAFDVPVGGATIPARIYSVAPSAAGPQPRVLLVGNEGFFNRPTLYGGAHSYGDNAPAQPWSWPRGWESRSTSSTATTGRLASCLPTRN